MIRQFESVGVVFVFLNAARISPTYRLRKREGQALERVYKVLRFCVCVCLSRSGG